MKPERQEEIPENFVLQTTLAHAMERSKVYTDAFATMNAEEAETFLKAKSTDELAADLVILNATASGLMDIASALDFVLAERGIGVMAVRHDNPMPEDN